MQIPKSAADFSDLMNAADKNEMASILRHFCEEAPEKERAALAARRRVRGSVRALRPPSRAPVPVARLLRGAMVAERRSGERGWRRAAYAPP